MGIVIVQGGGMYDEGTATAGTPGSFDANHMVPVNFTDLQGTTASPLTAWTAGQRVVLGDTTSAFWNGTAWVVGANVAPTFVNQAQPGTGTVGVAYAGYTYTATGDATIAFTIGTGALPGGLTLSTGGVLAGTPIAPTGTYNFTVRATNGAGVTNTAGKSIVIS